MSMNPFDQRPRPLDQCFMDWKTMAARPYDKREADPYTRVRSILMNGTEFEAVWFSHQFHRHCQNNDLRRELALLRRQEQQQQKHIAALKPLDETVLEHTIGYEQLAVDLTARMAQCEPDREVKQALDFALLEDFDHLYRYADLLEMDGGVHAEELVGRYTEIMPARPTIAHHRWPADSVKKPIQGKKAALVTKLHVNIITAAEQQTMNYYMNTAALWPEETGRRLYQEIGMIEEQHVTQYGSLLNPTLTPLENLLVHQYVESWLYWSMCETETDPHIRGVWQMLFEQELMHLNIAQGLLREYEGKEWNEVLPDAEFPAPLRLESNIEYVRGVLGSTANNTADLEDYVDVRRVTPETFAQYQRQVNQPVENVVSHSFIQAYIRKNGTDYRFETAPNPVAELKDRKADNVSVGRQTLCDESFTHTADDSVPIPELTR